MGEPFLGASSGSLGDDADAIVYGIAWDGGTSFRSGAAEGPAGIRRFSEGIETYSPRVERDLEELRIVDVGDHAGPPAEAAAGLGGGGPLLAVLGGDHSVTPPIVEAVGVDAVVGFDAHLDLRESYEGEHACTFHRIASRGVPCHLAGVRSGSRAEWEDAPRLLASVSERLALTRGHLFGRSLWVSVDVDVLDPSVAPGVGNPEPGGPTFTELLGALDDLRGLNVVGFDVVEVAPPLDPSGITQTAAAVLVREMLLRFASR